MSSANTPITDNADKMRPQTKYNLFQYGAFKSHSGLHLPDKIDCDALTSADWDTAAAWVARKISFQDVVGIPRGGLMFASALQQYKRADGHWHMLIVDDVLTTGRSMFEYRQKYPGAKGAVLFSRTPNVPEWIFARFVEQVI